MGESAARKYRKSETFGGLTAESLRGPSFRFCRLLFSILGWCVRFERMDKASRDAGYFVDRRQERGLIGLRRLVESANFPDELERSGTDLFGRYGWIKIEEGFDVPAHFL